jgi:5-methyltetrahydropteroyltriglutamate--homocysteine methyltransferase
VGALPADPEIWSGGACDERLATAAKEVVELQKQVGVDIVNEGEVTKGGNWLNFLDERLSGFQRSNSHAMISLLTGSDDWAQFKDFYDSSLRRGVLFEDTGASVDRTEVHDWNCIGPIRYVGGAVLGREISSLRRALGAISPGDAFLTSTAPASIEAGRTNEYYATQDEFLFELAEALRAEYETIAAAGLLVQIDDAWLSTLWDRGHAAKGLPAYKCFCMKRVEALNHALRNIPEEQVRYHLCWGSWHGPHVTDIPLSDMIDVILAVKAQAYLVEAANVRHEHEASVWETVKLPKGKILAPGVVSHSTKLIEHPELISNRIERFARMVGRENVIASTDCGLGLRCHPQIAWAKLRALREGADLATKRLWR